MPLRRLDAELARRGLARSREQARALIEAGAVSVRGAVALKPATQVDPADAIVVSEATVDTYVSRGAHKLASALDALQVDVTGARALDAGASTGGFTQLLLERGAHSVIAVDVGYGQLAWPLRTDERVTVLERTNVRMLDPDSLPYRPDLVVADLSFISLRLVLPALAACCAEGADLLLMVKPQFEVGRAEVGDGVVRDPLLRARAVRSVIDEALGQGLSLLGVAPSSLPGPSGNVEYFIWLASGRSRRAGDMISPVHAGSLPAAAPDIEAMVEAAIAAGPS